MSTYLPSEKFREAVSYLSSASALSQVSNATKLELYGLFKFLTVSPAPNTSRPSLFDFTGRAKWDAWNGINNTFAGSSAEKAENRYIDIARSLGWKEGALPGSGSDVRDDKEGESKGDRGDKGGMGVFVSTMKPPKENGEDIHSLAILGGAQKMAVLLGSDSSINVDDLDDYGYTPLHLSCDRGHVEVVKLLLENNADTNIKDPDDMTALELAEIAGHDEVMALLRSLR